MLEHLRPQLAGDSPHLVERAADRLLGLVDLVAMRRAPLRRSSSVQQHAGQHLPDLVVQVAGDADPLGLLRGEHAPAALLALALEPVEHRG